MTMDEISLVIERHLANVIVAAEIKLTLSMKERVSIDMHPSQRVLLPALET